jgi:hypothetical protein
VDFDGVSPFHLSDRPTNVLRPQTHRPQAPCFAAWIELEKYSARPIALTLVVRLKFSGYFLIGWDICACARSQETPFSAAAAPATAPSDTSLASIRR